MRTDFALYVLVIGLFQYVWAYFVLKSHKLMHRIPRRFPLVLFLLSLATQNLYCQASDIEKAKQELTRLFQALKKKSIQDKSNQAKKKKKSRNSSLLENKRDNPTRYGHLEKRAIPFKNEGEKKKFLKKNFQGQEKLTESHKFLLYDSQVFHLMSEEDYKKHDVLDEFLALELIPPKELMMYSQNGWNLIADTLKVICAWKEPQYRAGIRNFSYLCECLVRAGAQKWLIQELFGLLIEVFEKPARWGEPHDFSHHISGFLPTQKNETWRHAVEGLLEELHNLQCEFSLLEYREDIEKLYEVCWSFKQERGFMINLRTVCHEKTLIRNFLQIHHTQLFYSFLQSQEFQSQASQDMKSRHKEDIKPFKQIGEVLFPYLGKKIITPFDATIPYEGYFDGRKKLAQEMIAAKRKGEKKKNELLLAGYLRRSYEKKDFPQDVEKMIFSYLHYERYDFPGHLLYSKSEKIKVQPIDIVNWYAPELMPAPKKLAQLALTHPEGEECLRYFMEKKYIQLKDCKLLELSAHATVSQAHFKEWLAKVLGRINGNLQTLLDECPKLFLSLSSLVDKGDESTQLEKISHLKEVFESQQSLELFYTLMDLPSHEKESSTHYYRPPGGYCRPGPLMGEESHLYYLKRLKAFPELNKMYLEGQKMLNPNTGEGSESASEIESDPDPSTSDPKPKNESVLNPKKVPKAAPKKKTKQVPEVNQGGMNFSFSSKKMCRSGVQCSSHWCFCMVGLGRKRQTSHSQEEGL